MKAIRSITLIIFLLAPKAAWGNIYDARLEIMTAKQDSVIQNSLVLQMDLQSREKASRWQLLVMGETGQLQIPKGTAITRIKLPHEEREENWRMVSSTRRQITMLSFLCGELVTGVDVVAHIKSIRKSFRLRSPRRTRQTKDRKTAGLSWGLELGFMPDDDLELTARIRNSGTRFVENDYTFGIKSVSDEVGIKTAYHDGELDIRMGNVTLGSDVTAKVVVKF